MNPVAAQPVSPEVNPPPRFGPVTVEPPRHGRIAAIRNDPLPVTGAHPPLVAIVGAHGGAGATTLARWWAPAADSERCWPASPHTTQLVTIAARLCLPGLISCAERLREWRAELAPDGVVVVGVVLTAARPGKVPAAIRRYRTLIEDLAPAVWAIGWHEELLERELDELARFHPGDRPPPRRAPLTSTVPADVHHVGTDLIDHITRIRKTSRRQQDWNKS
ncbi:hypothetical protein ACFWUP_23770 [Nocardia sp. NPDC058658]|uniref:hypothetical protein n=1 Tax=Nocardia sp. NPDC058658 TaxID=3346580 RepID=UPI0036581F83